jgi:hypothetical protein
MCIPHNKRSGSLENNPIRKIGYFRKSLLFSKEKGLFVTGMRLKKRNITVNTWELPVRSIPWIPAQQIYKHTLRKGGNDTKLLE